MSFPWPEFHKLAKSLATDTTDDAALRSAISRAYYAVFHAATERIKLKQITIHQQRHSGGHGRHADLWKYFKAHPDAQCRQIGIEGDRLKQRRVGADYESQVHNLQKEAQSALLESDEIIRSIKELPPSLP